MKHLVYFASLVLLLVVLREFAFTTTLEANKSDFTPQTQEVESKKKDKLIDPDKPGGPRRVLGSEKMESKGENMEKSRGVEKMEKRGEMKKGHKMMKKGAKMEKRGDKMEKKGEMKEKNVPLDGKQDHQ